MAAEDRRHDDGDDGRSPSLPETEHREREREAADHGDDAPGRTPSLPETERREREQERHED